MIFGLIFIILLLAILTDLGTPTKVVYIVDNVAAESYNRTLAVLKLPIL